ncbi:Tetratricopeptide repeat family [Mycena sanguinolenta]|uniref:Tetratricopeptide repeat family n=1 Tax=Mycena sanguinolenta TaxID=230812 RepID=A0A8H6XTS2_9AGAR|nr:Tetratricopeptide repeat family [Mycena sanguinolenta]
MEDDGKVILLLGLVLTSLTLRTRSSRMDPITAATTIITFAAFIKDLIEIAQSIQRSIEMVSENRRRICDLTNDIVCTLVELANLTRGKEEAFQAPALLSALGNLKEYAFVVIYAFFFLINRYN